MLSETKLVNGEVVLVSIFSSKQEYEDWGIVDISHWKEGIDSNVRTYQQNYIAHNFSRKEFDTYCLMHPVTNGTSFAYFLNIVREINPAYIVCIINGHDLEHELKHARFYLDKEYRDTKIKAWEKLNMRERRKISKKLASLGYGEHVHVDEWQAYGCKYKNIP